MARLNDNTPLRYPAYAILSDFRAAKIDIMQLKKKKIFFLVFLKI